MVQGYVFIQTFTIRTVVAEHPLAVTATNRSTFVAKLSLRSLCSYALAKVYKIDQRNEMVLTE